jgi:DNA-binding transcriptional regulator YiaG
MGPASLKTGLFHARHEQMNPFWVNPRIGLFTGYSFHRGHCLKSVYTTEYEAFLQRLITARKNADLTQHDLADLLKKPQSFVSKYERRERRLDVVEFLVIAKAISADPYPIIREIDALISPPAKKRGGQ